MLLYQKRRFFWEVREFGEELELANRNGNRYSKDGTGNHGGARVKGDPGKEDIASGILSRTIYERDNSDSSCDSELSKCSFIWV